MKSEKLDIEVIEKCKAKHKQITKEVSHVIVGQSEVVDEVLMALFCNSHILLVGVPGLAKTLLISTLAEVLDLKYKRVQFTPDLLPGDITGSEVIEENKVTGRREFRFIEGPVFTNLLLADEINRTPPKTQSALLQAMQEREVSIGNDTKKLDAPFLVMATQNPLEQEGTYPLPEAQLDRFMFNTFVDYPTDEELIEIVEKTTGTGLGEVKAVMNAEEILEVQQVVRRIPIARPVVEYLVNLSAISRPGHPGAPDYIKKYLSWGWDHERHSILLLEQKHAQCLMENLMHLLKMFVRLPTPFFVIVLP